MNLADLPARAARRARRARSDLHATPDWRRRRPRAVHARTAYAIAPDSTTTYSKNPDLPVQGASTIKLLACATARGILTDLDQPWTIHPGDDCRRVDTGTVVRVGDTLTVSDLFHASMIASDPHATGCLARAAGTVLLDGQPGNPTARFLSAMTDYATDLGWGGHVIRDASGFHADNRVTARQLVALMAHVATSDLWLYDVAAKPTHVLTVTGPHERRQPITHTATEATGLAAAKTGTVTFPPHDPASHAYIVATWHGPDGLHIGAVCDSDPANRYLDVQVLTRT